MRSLIPLTLAVLAALAAAGCTSPQAKRSAEFPSVLAGLPAEVQARVLNGVVEEGFTSDMVYIALGKPSEIATGEEGGRQVEVWTYQNYVPGTYSTPRTSKPGIRQSQALSQWGDSSLPSTPSARGDQIITPRTGSGTGGVILEANAVTLRLLFANGRVIAVRYAR